MAATSAIEWTDATFNPWWGCAKVSDGCKNCYAEGQAGRFGFDVWGPGKDRRFFGDKHWQEPLKWNAAAKRAGERRRVFCASMADVFEDRRDLDLWRDRLWRLIQQCPWLDWQLVTKRPENFARFLPWGKAPADAFERGLVPWKNVWLLVSVEDQEQADRRIPRLCETPAAVRGLSCEPLLGPVDVSPWLDRLGWVIVGGESGHGARPCDVGWVRSVVGQCKAAAVACFVKQLGATVVTAEHTDWPDGGFTGPSDYAPLRDKKGGDPAEWPADLRVREFPPPVEGPAR